LICRESLDAFIEGGIGRRAELAINGEGGEA
jgi:hypothetical protein